MDTLKAMQIMLEASDVTPYRAAKMLGRGSSYISGMVWRGSCPSADLLARLADACGWRLVLLPPDGLDVGALTIDGGAAPASAPPADSAAAPAAGAPPAG